MDLARVFPPFGLRVACGDLELRLPDDAELARLADALGYAPNGVVLRDRQGEVATENRYRLTREAWVARPEAHRLDVTLEGVAPVRAMLGMAAAPA